MNTLYPLRFSPIYKNYMWGGRRFHSALGRKLEPEVAYAESWEVSDHPHGQSLVENGPLRGTTLNALVTRRSEELLGRHHPQARFPLLLKYLDASRRLSVQVHPDDRLARQMGLADLGKTEAWVVLEAEPGSPIWAGFNRAVDRKSLADAIRRGDLEPWLNRIEPRAGDCLFVPAGTVHALGEGLLVAEIQQTSDSTFRLFDWNRLGSDGKPRPLHVEEALQAIDYRQQRLAPQPPQPTDVDHVWRLVDCDQFILDRRTFRASDSVAGDNRFHVLTLIQGAVTVQGDPSREPLERGRTVLLPAGSGPVTISTTSDEPAVILDAYLP
jgi:mannose-6-phosphate isomerase